MKRRIQSILLCALAASLAPQHAHAAAFALHEQSGVAMGTAGAYGAAQSAASIFYNPAGIADLEGVNLELGVSVIAPKATFTGPTDRPEYQTVDAEEQIFPPVNAYLTWRLNEQHSVGLGFFSYAGLGTKYEENWVGREVSEEITLTTFTLNPVYGYRVNERIRLAVGLSYMFGTMDLSKDVYLGMPFNSYADMKLEGDGSGLGYTLGLQMDATEKLTVGLSYRSGITLAAEGDVSFDYSEVTEPTHVAVLNSQLPKTTAEVDVAIPDVVIVGLEYRTEIKYKPLIWRFDVVYMQWSDYEELAFDFAQNTDNLQDTVLPKNYDDTYAFRTGLEYHLSDKWQLRAGYYYETAAVPEEQLEPSLPDAVRNSFSVGASWQATEGLWLDAFALYITEQDRQSTFEDLPAAYEASIPIFGISVRKSF